MQHATRRDCGLFLNGGESKFISHSLRAAPSSTNSEEAASRHRSSVNGMRIAPGFTQGEVRRVTGDAMDTQTKKGILFDSTLCIGCGGCYQACKEKNNLPR